MSERLSAGIGPHERGEQRCDPVGRQTVPFPQLERRAELGDVLAIELDGPMLPGGFEFLPDRSMPGSDRQFLEQSVTVPTGDLDDFSRDVDQLSVGAALFHSGRAYNWAPA